MSKAYTEISAGLEDAISHAKGKKPRAKVHHPESISAKAKPGDARKGLKLLNFKLVWFLLTFLFRK